MSKYISRYGSDGHYLRKAEDLRDIEKLSALDLIKLAKRDMEANKNG